MELSRNLISNTALQTKKDSIRKRIKKNWQLLLILLPGLIFFIIFRYGPMYGIIIAFKDFNVYKGIMSSDWVGMKNFIKFFNSPDFTILFRNTFLLGFYSLAFTFPFPVMFAVLLNEVRNKRLKKIVQTTSFLPSLISVVVVCSMVIDFLSPNTGIFNKIIEILGFEKQYFMILPRYFRTIYITSTVWQRMGYEAVIYIAAIAGISSELYEAAKIDGCTRIKSIWHITLPSILPIITIMLILKSGQLLRIGYTKVLLLYNPATYEVADVFSTYVYRKGLLELDYSFATAVGLFESVISLVIIFIVDRAAKACNQQGFF